MTTDPEINALAVTMSELRSLLEQSNAHAKVAVDRYNDLRLEFDTFKHTQLDLATDVAMLRKRLDEIRPPQLNCPHCGRKVQPEWVTCRICLKPLT